MLNRVEAIADDASGTTRFAEYEYLGAGTIVAVKHPEVNGGLTLDYNTTGDYEGWDTFGRVINQEWTNGAGTTTLDHYTYTYDYNSNRTSRHNALHSDLDEDYTYDGMNRLVGTDRDGSAYQSWDLDSLGNWNSFDDDGTVTDREHNEANELVAISGSTIDPTYDAAGNMISGPRPDSPTDRQHYIYDAWNRMVEALDDDNGTPDNTLITFEYDGRNYRIQKTGRGVAQAFFYNEGQQLLETQSAGSTAEEHVWDLRYIDAPVLRETRGGILYFTNDANFNVTGLVDEDTGNVVERYHYDPYGKALYLDGSWTALMTQESAHDNVYLYTGRRLDVETALMYYRARYYDTLLGRFVSRDPIANIVRDSDFYVYVLGNPLSWTDSSGLCVDAKCCVETFSVPKNLEQPILEQKHVGPLPTTTGRFRAQFEMVATFKNDAASGCLSECCEYRQFIRGVKFLNGRPVTLDNAPVPLHPAIYREDTAVIRDDPPEGYRVGELLRYGLRSASGFGTDVYDRPDRATGTRYRGRDEPGVYDFNIGVDRVYELTFSLEFMGIIIDRCAMQQDGVVVNEFASSTPEMYAEYTKASSTWKISGETPEDIHLSLLTRICG